MRQAEPEDEFATFLRCVERMARQLLTGFRNGGPTQLWNFQLRLLDLQRDIQKAIGAEKCTPRSNERNQRIEALQWARWQARHLGDASAWLLLGLDETIVVPLGENSRTSIAPDSSSMRGVVVMAEVLANNGAGMPILNDITDCLRIGDLTFVKPTGDREREVATVEVKTHVRGETIDSSGIRSEQLSIDVHSVSRTNIIGQASERIPRNETNGNVTPPPVRIPDRRIDNQVRRMRRATDRHALEPNAIGDVAGEPFISLEMTLAGATHIDVVRRVLRRARRTGLSIEQADDAFTYIAVYHPTDPLSVLKSGLVTGSAGRLSNIVPSGGARDPRDMIVINALLPYAKVQHPYRVIPYFLLSLPKTTIFDLMHRKMILASLANPGPIARALEAENFTVETKKRGRQMPHFRVSCDIANADLGGFRLTMPGFDNELHDTLIHFRTMASLIERYKWQREALSGLVPDVVEHRRNPDANG